MSSAAQAPRRFFHFQLKTDRPCVLKAFGKGYALQPHTPQSLAGFPELGTDPDKSVTHFAEVDTPPKNAIQLLRVYGPPDANGIPSLETMAVYTPESPTAYSREDLAKALMFLHPHLIVLTAEHGPTVLGHIASDQNFDELTFTLENLDAWNTVVIKTDAGGNALRTLTGKPLYEYRLADEVTNLRAAVARGATVAVNDDARLRTARWNVLDGMSHRTISSNQTLAAASGYRYQMQDPGPKYGISAHVVRLTDDFELTLKITNGYIRHCSAFVSFLGGDRKTPIALRDELWMLLVEASIALVLREFQQYTNTDFDFIFDHTHVLKFLGTIGPEATFLGIPVAEASSEFTFKLPQTDDTIGAIRVVCGSLGLPSGHEWDPLAAWVGIGLTAFIDLVIPTVSLIATVGVESNTLFDSIFKDWKFIVPTIGKIALAIKDIVEHPDRTGDDLKEFFIGLADSLLDKVLNASDVAAKLAAYFGAEEVEEAIPIVGWALKAAAIEGTVAQLAQTVGEVVGSQRVVEFDVTVTMSTRLTLIPREKGGFPATAASYTVTAQYTDVTGYVHTADLSNPKVDRIEFTWDDMPVGGKVKFLVAVYSREGWLVGKGASELIPNIITPGQDALVVPPIAIEEILYPLTSHTTYRHQQLLRYDGGHHHWLGQTSPPRETARDLGTGEGGHVLDSLTGISLNNDLGILGYSWQASGQGVPVIGTTEPLDEPVYTMQNVSFGPSPEAGLMFTAVGYNASPLPAYIRSASPDRTGIVPKEIGGGFFFLDPVEQDGFHLRGVVPVTDPTIPPNSPARMFDHSTTTSWGRFHLKPDSIAVHSTGCVVAVTKGYDKLHILELPQAATPSRDAPWARMLSGPGTREGLLGAPQLVAIAPNQTVYVLEAGNARIQAFSRGGHPIKAFPESSTPYWIPLFSESADSPTVTYASMSIEIKGHIYVLSFEDDGYAPNQFRLDIYTPLGTHLLRQRGINVAAMTVDLWRNLYTLNFQAILGPGSRTEPSVSEWIPSTPKGA